MWHWWLLLNSTFTSSYFSRRQQFYKLGNGRTETSTVIVIFQNFRVPHNCPGQEDGFQGCPPQLLDMPSWDSVDPVLYLLFFIHKSAAWPAAAAESEGDAVVGGHRHPVQSSWYRWGHRPGASWRRRGRSSSVRGSSLCMRWIGFMALPSLSSTRGSAEISTSNGQLQRSWWRISKGDAGVGGEAGERFLTAAAHDLDRNHGSSFSSTDKGPADVLTTKSYLSNSFLHFAPPPSLVQPSSTWPYHILLTPPC